MVAFRDNELIDQVHSKRELLAACYMRPGIHLTDTMEGRVGRAIPVLDIGTTESASHSFSSEDTLLDTSLLTNFSSTIDKDPDFPRSVPSTDSSYFSMPSTTWNTRSPSENTGITLCDQCGYETNGKPQNHDAHHAEYLIIHNSSLARSLKDDCEQVSSREDSSERRARQLRHDYEQDNLQYNKDRSPCRSCILRNSKDVVALLSEHSTSASERPNASEFIGINDVCTGADLRNHSYDTTKVGKSIRVQTQLQSNTWCCSSQVLDDHSANLNQSSRNTSSDELSSNSVTLYDSSQMPTPSTDSLDSFSSEESNFCIYEDDIPAIANKSLTMIVPVLATRFLESYHTMIGRIRNDTGGTQDQENQGQCQGGKPPPRISSATKHPDKDEQRKRSDLGAPDENEDDNGSKRKSKKQKGCPNEDDKTILWACPYMKRSPKEYRSCQKYILKDISRVKQHLRRTHKIPLYCPRCNAEFESEKERDAHNRVGTCPIREAKTWEGVTAEQALLLDRRVDRRQSKREQWYSIFEILFPGRYLPCSPYIDYTLSAELQLFREHVESRGQEILVQTIRERIPQSVVVHTDDNIALLQSGFQEAIYRILHSFQSTDVPALPHQTNGHGFTHYNYLELGEGPVVESQGENAVSPELDSITETPAIGDVLYQMRLPSDTGSLEDVTAFSSTVGPLYEMPQIHDGLLEGFIGVNPWLVDQWNAGSWPGSLTAMDPDVPAAECDPSAGSQVDQPGIMSSLARSVGDNNLEKQFP